ncbi:hypothetical protein GSY69_12565 [Brevibacterium sp. 5221]|uniref:Uncharacterized protein n=1 Tax=Brevibacterium rongguiense TaxID=2695267 RepID=A0A6N9H9K5_9MICO|nr:hypothetical protein [Brevibacterium rongguiense]MYM20770.1 hypothetical protein [Brevibacterium rongguiense]
MEYVKVLLPSLVVGLLFWYVLRAILRADSTERREMDRYYAQLDEREPHARAGDAAPPAAVEQASTETPGGTHGTRDEGRPD